MIWKETWRTGNGYPCRAERGLSEPGIPALRRWCRVLGLDFRMNCRVLKDTDDRSMPVMRVKDHEFTAAILHQSGYKPMYQDDLKR